MTESEFATLAEILKCLNINMLRKSVIGRTKQSIVNHIFTDCFVPRNDVSIIVPDELKWLCILLAETRQLQSFMKMSDCRIVNFIILQLILNQCLPSPDLIFDLISKEASE